MTINYKANYLNSLIARYSADSNRGYLAFREIQTLKLLLDISYPDLNLSIGPPCGAATQGTSVLHSFLDLGAGDQFMGDPLSSLGCSYLPLDIQDCDFESSSLPVDSGSLDCVISLAVIEHLNNASNFISESFRALRPGGLLWLSTPNWHHCSRDFYNDYTHVTPYTPQSIVAAVASFGFTRVHAYPNLRCKPKWCYTGPRAFLRARFMFPFTNNSNFPVPSFLKGKAKGIFLLAIKPEDV